MFKPEFMICWVLKNYKNWEIVNGEEELQLYIAELIDNGVDENYIIVFDMDREIK